MATVVVVDVDGSARRCDLVDTRIGLEFLQGCVGGWVEVVAVTSGLDMWCNEEGRLVGLPVNRVASRLLQAFGAGQLYVGPVVFTGGTDRHGCTLGLDESQAAMLLSVATDLSDGRMQQ